MGQRAYGEKLPPKRSEELGDRGEGGILKSILRVARSGAHFDYRYAENSYLFWRAIERNFECEASDGELEKARY